MFKKNWANLITTEPCSPEAWELYGLYMGNHPQMAARFRLVKYSNLPRWIMAHMSHMYWICGYFLHDTKSDQNLC